MLPVEGMQFRVSVTDLKQIKSEALERTCGYHPSRIAIRNR